MPSSTVIYTLSLHDALPIFFEDLELAVEQAGWHEMAAPVRHAFGDQLLGTLGVHHHDVGPPACDDVAIGALQRRTGHDARNALDRKSTRLNSSHVEISYAVFHRDLHSFPTRRSSDLLRGS